MEPVDDLSVQAAGLAESVSGLAEAVVGLQAATARSRLHIRWTAVALVVDLVLSVFVGVLLARAAGETSRVHAAADGVAARLQAETRADCAFKRDIAVLPALVKQPSPVLTRLARDAADAFYGKGCPQAVDPETGKPFGQLPPPQRANR